MIKTLQIGNCSLKDVNDFCQDPKMTYDMETHTIQYELSIEEN